MALSIKLKSSQVTLFLEGKDHNWAHMSVVKNNHSMKLGAERFTLILDQLLVWLETEQFEDADGTIEGKSVRWVFSLAENHYVCYGSMDLHKILYLMNSNKNPPVLEYALRLSPDITSMWINQIRKFKTDYFNAQ